MVNAAIAVQVELTASSEAPSRAVARHGGRLRRLREWDVHVITIANFSPAMLRGNAEHAGLTTLFDALISADPIHTYKPDPRAYQLGVDRNFIRHCGARVSAAIWKLPWELKGRFAII